MSGILIIRLKGLGDIVHLIPVLKMLRRDYSQHQVALLCQKPFGHIIPRSLNIKVFELPAHAGFLETIKLLKQIRKQKFTYLFDLFANPRTAVITLLSGIKKKFGFDYRIRRNAYTQTYSPPDPNLHLMRLFAEFFAEFGFKGQIEPPDLIPDPEFYEPTDKFFAANNLGKTVVAVNPHTTYPSKAWPREHFIKFIELWHTKFKSPVIITWGPGEKNAAQEIVKDAGSDKAVLQPEVNIMEFAAFLSRLNLFVTADTGPMNIAWAVNTPTVALFGPTTRKAVAPEGPQHLSLFNPEIECLQCHQEVCSHKSCMYSMKPEWVFDKIIKKYKLDKNS